MYRGMSFISLQVLCPVEGTDQSLMKKDTKSLERLLAREDTQEK